MQEKNVIMCPVRKKQRAQLIYYQWYDGDSTLSCCACRYRYIGINRYRYSSDNDESPWGDVWICNSCFDNRIILTEIKTDIIKIETYQNTIVAWYINAGNLPGAIQLRTEKL